MKWSATGLFATPLIKINLGDTAYVAQYFKESIKANTVEQSIVDKNSPSGKLGHYQSQTHLFLLHPELSRFREKIEQAGSFAYKELLNYKKSGPLSMTNAWFNMCDVGGSQQKHTHANSLISGTVYLNTDQHTEITFFHPLSHFSMHAELYDEADKTKNAYGLHYHYQEVTVSVQAGDCLFWPSQLPHGYKNNQTPDRLSLSFNMMPEYTNTLYQVCPSPA